MKAPTAITGEGSARGNDAQRPIRVLQLIGSLHPGGAERVVAQLATGLDPARFEVRVVCTRQLGSVGDEISAKGIAVSALTSRSGPAEYLAPWRLLQAIRMFKPHVIHSHGIVALTAVGPLGMLGLLPKWVHTFHFGNYPYASRRQMRLEALFCRRASRLVCVAPAQRDAIVRHHGLGLHRIDVVSNGIGANRYLDNDDQRCAKRKELGFADGDFVVATVCVLSEQKGVRYFLEAAQHLVQAHADVRLLVVGSGPLDAHLRRQAKLLGIDKHVLFTGWRADIEELLVAIDVFVMASLWEAMPLALLEAMAARRPMVVSDVGDNSLFVDGGNCAILVPPGDSGAIATAIERLRSDRESATRLAACAHKRYESCFGVARMLDAYGHIYGSARPRTSLRNRLRFAARAMSNVHVRGKEPDIFVFATPRGGSTWLMEILASQPGMKFYDEPMNPRRPDVAHGGWVPDFEALMPETGDAARILQFLRSLQDNRHGYMNPTPLRPFHRFLTRRIVFKIHEIEHMMEDVLRTCGGIGIYLLRHPVATSLSRHVLPRLDLFMSSQYYSELVGGAVQLAEARRIAAAGSRLQRAMVSWCFENLVALRTPPTGTLIVTYEELVLNPERSAEFLGERLQLPDRRRLLAAFDRPASNISMSDKRTMAAMNRSDHMDRRRRLVTKWQSSVNASDLAQVSEILSLFGIDAYASNRILADSRYLLFSDTPALAGDTAG